MANVSLWNKGVLILFSLTLIKQFVKAVLLGAKAVGINKPATFAISLTIYST